MPLIPVQQVQIGDVLLHSGKGEVSKLIQWASDSDYSHTALVIDTNKLAEAVSDGVHLGDSLPARAADQEDFWFIDVFRPRSSPLSPADQAAIQQCAASLKGAKFALSQMFELGLICVLKNKLPPTLEGRILVWCILDQIVKSDPTRVLCSEFVYRTFAGAQTNPPGKLKPDIEVVMHPARPFPKVNWEELWREYEAARPHGAPASSIVLPAGLFASAATAQREIAALYAKTRVLLLGNIPNPNPENVLPQDFADSCSFQALGRLVP